ncbi:MAG: helix-turn-helix domain-containing protein [Eubacterium sp.]|nr:helix-turn-helix domain-containing protein [Eubacterium sp.]
MQLSKNKINVAIAKEQITITKLAERYGVSRSRMNLILNSREVTPVCAGRLAKALNVDVTELLED